MTKYNLQFFGGRGASSTGGTTIPTSNGHHVVNTADGSLVYEVSSDEIYLEHIIVNEGSRQSGVGTSMLNKVISLSNKENKPVRLMASPIEGDITTKQLIDWYKKHGFTMEQSYGSLGARMVYNPRGKS